MDGGKGEVLFVVCCWSRTTRNTDRSVWSKKINIAKIVLLTGMQEE